jgi:hypothetical protein
VDPRGGRAGRDLPRLPEPGCGGACSPDDARRSAVRGWPAPASGDQRDHYDEDHDRGGRCGARASIAGLLAARVLADAHARVTVIERDYLPHDLGHRRGVPQGRHLHALQPRGRQLLDELFPGFTKQMVRAGAGIGDHLGGVRWQLSGQRLRQVDIGRSSLAASRPLLEGQVRRRVKALPSVVSSRAASRGRHVLPANRQDDRYPLGDRGQRRSGLPRRGWPPQHQGAVGQYLPARLHAAATTDNSLADAFIRVMGMVDRPESLLRPDRALRVLVDTPARRTRADGRASLGQPHL